MLRWASVTAEPNGRPTSPGPQATTLIGGALLVLAAFVPIRLWASSYVVAAAFPVVVGLLAVATVLGIALVTARVGRAAWAVMGIVVLDLLPVVLVLGAPHPAEARARAAWLVIPTVLAAAHPRTAVRLGQWAVACLLGAGVLLATGLRGLGAAVDIAVLIGILTVAMVLVARMADLASTRRDELIRVSRTDPLTGVLNRRGLVEEFPALLAAVRAGSGRIGVLLLDIDHFKQLNDRFGHAHGDAVLQQVAALLTTAHGTGGLVGRIGGEELVVLVDGDPAPVAHAFRASLADRSDLGVTVSIGIVHEPLGADPAAGEADRSVLAALLLAADRALYQAKDDGRDRVRVGRVEPSTGAIESPVLADVPVPVARERAPASTSALLFGLMLLVFALVGVGAMLTPGRMPGGSLWHWVFAATLAVSIGTAVALIVRRPAIGARTLLGLCLGADLVVVLALLLVEDPSTRRFGATILVIPTMLIAADLPRPVILGQYLLAAILCGWVSYQPGIAPGLWLLSVTQLLVTVVGPAELIFWISRRHDRLTDQLHRWVVSDPLTGAANRRGLQVAFASRTGVGATVIAVDIDRFKAVNDQLGHPGGDDALIRLASGLRAVVGSGGVVARTGGDEFVLVTAPGEARTPTELADLVSAAGRALPVPLSLSVGLAVVESAGVSSVWDVVAAADLSLTRRRAETRSSPQISASSPVAAEPSAE
jgi:diguanylate cyclase (GGDEF)-like protein